MRHLRLLVAQEVIERQPDSRFSTKAEYRFRHALVRDAAYALVPDNHRDVERMDCAGTYAVALHLALVEACFAEGDAKRGEAALREASRCVRLRASDIPEAEARERFLRQVPENARALELARQRWGALSG